MRKVLFTSLRRSLALVDRGGGGGIKFKLLVISVVSPSYAKGSWALMYASNCSGFPRTEKLVQGGNTGNGPSALSPLGTGLFGSTVGEGTGFMISKDSDEGVETSEKTVESQNIPGSSIGRR